MPFRRSAPDLKRRAKGVVGVLQSGSALRHHRGLRGQAKGYAQAYAYLHKRSRWMRYQSYRRQHLPIGSGITSPRGVNT